MVVVTHTHCIHCSLNDIVFLLSDSQEMKHMYNGSVMVGGEHNSESAESVNHSASWQCTRLLVWHGMAIGSVIPNYATASGASNLQLMNIT